MIPVCYACNKKIFHGVVLSAISIAKRTREALCVYVLTMDLHGENPEYLPVTDNLADELREILKSYNPENDVRLIDVTKMYLEDGLGTNNDTACTPYSLIRLYMDVLDMPKKIIYLDTDVMLVRDLEELYEIDMTGVEIAAVRDVIAPFRKNKKYFNSGVLLLNFDEIEKTGYFSACRDMIRSEKMKWADQTALNALVKSLKLIPRKFNEVRKLKKDTVIKHFCRGMRVGPSTGYYIGPFYVPPVYRQWDRDLVRKKLKTDIFEEDYSDFDAFDERFSIMKQCSEGVVADKVD